jgi:hypothetical protein
MQVEIKTAEKIIAAHADPEMHQGQRRAARETPLMRAIYRIFLAGGGPVPTEEIATALPAIARSTLESDLASLDEGDLIHLADGRVEVAYPFSARPTPFVVRLGDGRERFVCCAIDALGMASMVGDSIEVLGRCHHCGDSLSFAVHPDNPGPEAEGVMVWVGRRGEGERRATTGL